MRAPSFPALYVGPVKKFHLDQCPDCGDSLDAQGLCAQCEFEQVKRDDARDFERIQHGDLEVGLNDG